jgi:hypothetical protein
MPAVHGRSLLRSRMLSTACGLVAAVCGLTACGGTVHGTIVARVGGSTIREGEVAHWANAIAAGAMPAGTLTLPRSGSPRQAALGFLISSRWLIGQAAADGTPVSKRAVERVLRGRREADGEELVRGLGSTGRTSADARLEIEAELAVEAIRAPLLERASRITPRETLAYYRRHVISLGLGELRGVEIIEGLPSRAAALALVRRSTAASFSARALHEYLELISTTDRQKAAVLRAIFTARPGVIGGPLRFNGWTVFVVTRIVPPRRLPFSQARASAAALLIAERRRSFIGAFFEGYRNRWISRTNCQPSYIVRGCAQYRGTTGPEPNPFWNAIADAPELPPRPVRVPPPQ